MIPAQDLFRLIHSLSKSEKRYFKLSYISLAGKEGNNYKNLFDAIARQKEYDEHSIRHALKDIKDFANTKHHLYRLLLRYLRLYHARSSASSRLHEMFHSIEILFDKGLLPECANMVKQAQRIAMVYDKDLILLELLDWEIRLIRESEYKKITKKKLSKIAQQKISLLKKHKSISEYSNIHDQYALLKFQHHNARVKGVKKKIYSVMNPARLNKKNLPQEAAMYMHKAYASYFRIMGDPNKYYEHCKWVIQLIESSPVQLIERQKEYLNALIHICISLSELQRFKESYNLLYKMRAIPAKNEHIALHVFYHSYVLEFDLLLAAVQFEKAVHLVKTVDAGLKRFKGKISDGRYITFCYYIAYSYFSAGNYSSVIEWSNKIINNPETDMRIDIHSAARLLNLMAHIEKGNWDFAGRLSKSVRKFLEKNKHIYRFENLLLQFVSKKLAHTMSAAQVSDAFKEWKPKAEKILKNPFESKILLYIDFPSWIESKIKNRPFAEIVKEKVKG